MVVFFVLLWRLGYNQSDRLMSSSGMQIRGVPWIKMKTESATASKLVSLCFNFV